MVDFLFVIIELCFAISYGWDVISGNMSKSMSLKGVGHFERKFETKGGITHQPLLVSEKHSCLHGNYVLKDSSSLVFCCFQQVSYMLYHLLPCLHLDCLRLNLSNAHNLSLPLYGAITFLSFLQNAQTSEARSANLIKWLRPITRCRACWMVDTESSSICWTHTQQGL